LRPSVLIRFGEHRVLIDTSPDLRCQALRFGIERLDGVLYTHSHADHILGLDDIRPFNFMQRKEIPIYGSREALEVIERTFRYVFDDSPTESSRPQLIRHAFDEGPVVICGLEFLPIRLAHGKGTVYGFRFGDCAYLTDHSEIPEESMAQFGRSVSGCFALQPASNPFDRRSIIENGRDAKPSSRLLYSHLARFISRGGGRADAGECSDRL
jgi:phosphoribosyl 1,2-cyclic phosphate phosphodiesterase